MRLKNQVAIITGAGRGIGRAIALRMAEEGAKVVVSDVNYESCIAVVREIEQMEQQGLAVKANVADRAEVAELVAAAMEKWGSVDILINNAGVTRDALIKDLTEEQWDTVMTVDLKSIYLCTQAVLTAMLPQNKGRIINIASVAGEMGNVGQVNYSAAKAGAIAIAKTGALELARYNITVNAIAPGFIDTEMTAALPEKVKDHFLQKIPLRRMGKGRDIANACVFLASEEGEYITGQVLRVNGGWYM